MQLGWSQLSERSCIIEWLGITIITILSPSQLHHPYPFKSSRKSWIVINIDNLIISFLRVGPVGFFFSLFFGMAGPDGLKLCFTITFIKSLNHVLLNMYLWRLTMDYMVSLCLTWIQVYNTSRRLEDNSYIIYKMFNF